MVLGANYLQQKIRTIPISSGIYKYYSILFFSTMTASFSNDLSSNYAVVQPPRDKSFTFQEDITRCSSSKTKLKIEGKSRKGQSANEFLDQLKMWEQKGPVIQTPEVSKLCN